MAKRGCVTVSCVKTWFLVFAAVLFLVAAGLFGIGVWTLLFKNQYEPLLGSVTYITTVGLMIAGGLFSMFVCIFGIVGAFRESRFMVLGFFLMVLIVCLLEVVGGVIAYIYRDSIEIEITKSLNVSIASNYGMMGDGNDRKTMAIDFLQTTYRCCGDVDYKSWEKSEWYKTNTTDTSVPDSCCITPSAKCGKRVHPSNIWRNDYDPEYNGCFRSLKNYFIEQLFIIGIACFASGLAQVVCIFLSGWLYRLIVEFRYI